MEIVQSTRRRCSSPTIVKSTTVWPKDYHYKDILHKEIKPEDIRNVIFSSNDLGCDMSLFRSLLNRESVSGLIFLDFDAEKYVDSILEQPFPDKCFLVDDGNRVSREYIDLTKLKNIKQLVVPLDYLVWGVQFNDKVDTYCFQVMDCGCPKYISWGNGNTSLSRNDLEKINQTIEELSSYHSKDAIDKLCLISDFLQSRTQFIYGKESIGNGICFITPEMTEHCLDNGYIEVVLNHNRGVCMGIANLSIINTFVK